MKVETLESNGRFWYSVPLLEGEPSTDAWKESSWFDMRFLKNVELHILATGKDVKYNVYGAIDKAHPKLLTVDGSGAAKNTVVSAGSDGVLEWAGLGALGYLKVQFASNAAGQSGQVTVLVAGKY